MNRRSATLPFSFALHRILAVAVITFVSLARAATMYVDQQLGSATCATYNPTNRSCSDGSEQAYQSITAASTVSKPGDIILIRAGNYAEQLRPANSGSLDQPITYAAYQAELVKVGAGDPANPGVLLSDRSHIVLDGIHVEDRAWLEARNTHFTLLRNCVFLRTPAAGTTGNARFVSSTFNRVINCTFLEGHDNLLLIDANYNLVQGCTLATGRHSVFGIRCGDYNIIRSNILYNPLQKISEIYDCGEGTSAVPNSFNSTHHNIFEENIFGPCELGAGYHDTTSNGNGMQYGGQEGIIRRNVFYQCNVGLGMAVYADESMFNVNNRIYHNVFFQNKGSGICPRGGNTNTVYKNNILFQNGGCIGGCVAATSPGQIVYRSDMGPLPFGPGALFDRNDIIFQNRGQAVIEDEFGGGLTLVQFNTRFPSYLFNTLEVDPQFVNAATNNFHLRSTSPLIDAGAFLTRTSLPGAGSLIPVQDALNFTDGFGIPGELGDLVQFDGETQPARVLLVDYALNTLLIDRAITWSANQGISLPYNGPAPDIGAFEFSGDGIQLNFSFADGILKLTWPAGFGYVLFSSSNFDGPYSPTNSEDGSYSEPVSNTTRFFQLRRP